MHYVIFSLREGFCSKKFRTCATYLHLTFWYGRPLMQVGATPDLMVAYIDFFLGGDEKRLDMVSIIQKRFPMCIIFGGDGSYMSPYNIHSDSILTNLVGQVSMLSIVSFLSFLAII